MTSTHPAFDEALEAIRRRKGIVWPPAGPDTEPDDDEPEPLPPVAMPSRPVDLDARDTVFLRFIVLHDLSRPVSPNLGGKRQQRLKGLLRSQDSRCRYCGKTVGRKHSTLDHVVPLARGGMSTPDNLTLACNRCNGTKGDWTPTEWLGWLEQTAANVREFLNAGQFVSG